MTQIKEILKITAIVFLNIALVLSAFYVYEAYTLKIIHVTEISSDNIATIVYPLIFGLGVFAFFRVKWIRPYLIGLIAVCISGIIFSFFYANKKFANPGKHKLAKLRNLERVKGGLSLNVDFTMWANQTKVTPDKFVGVDSVEIRVDRGFFGVAVMSDEIDIPECGSCNYNLSDSVQSVERCLYIGDSLFEKRCFHLAIEQFTKCLLLDSTNTDAYYDRGVAYMLLKKYDRAYDDLVRSAIINYRQCDKEGYLSVEDPRLTTSFQEVMNDVKNKKEPRVEPLLKAIDDVYAEYMYQEKIEFCKEQMSNM
ncbi:MAG: hypothetical protein ACJ77K_15870 [Bacteroidia bacterium]